MQFPTQPRRRGTARLAAVAVAGLTALTLTACGDSGSSDPSSSSSNSSSSDSASGASSNIDDIKVEGGSEKQAPKVTLPSTPFKVDKTTVKVLKEGDGAKLTDKDIATVDVELVNGADGKVASSSYEQEPTGLYLGQSDLLAGLKTAISNQKVGSRILAAVPPADGFGETGNSALKIGADDTMIFVIDVKSATQMLTEAKGKAVAPKKGLPTVTFHADKAADVKIPKDTKAPTKLVVQPLVTGEGAKVKEGQVIRVSYTGVLWRNGEKFDSSFDHEPGYFEFSVGAGNVIKGWDQGLVNQPVGSRVLLVVPPAQGYGASGNPPTIKGTDTLVFVVDILGAY